MIERVEMSNWRAFEQREFAFEPGLTFLLGANGAGKSSVLSAILYALSGEPSSTGERAAQLRDAGREGAVRVWFDAGGQRYRAERAFSAERAAGARLVRAGDEREVLAATHKALTAGVEELLGVSAAFLRRILSMPEGEAFRFLQDPPGDALDAQLRRALGLGEMDTFAQALARAEKTYKERGAVLADLMKELDGLGVRWNADFERKGREAGERRQGLLARLSETQARGSELKREQQERAGLAPLLERALAALQRDGEVWQALQSRSVDSAYAQLERDAEEARAALQQCQVDRARLEGEAEGTQRTLHVLLPYAGRDETLPCPVCGKAMTGDEREAAVRHLRQHVDEIGVQRASLSALQDDAQAGLQRAQARLDAVRPLREAPGRGQDATPLLRLQEAWLEQRARFEENRRALEARDLALHGQLQDLESEQARYVAARRRLQELGYATPEEAARALVAIEARSLSLRAGGQAARDALTLQRNRDLRAVYEQIARVWAAFAGRGEWQVEFEAGGMPRLQDAAGRHFSLGQLSGGEKTALLVVLHVIVAHHFSRGDFLLIDEPLEHLDAVNRRSLIRFLVAAQRRSLFRQAIVATFEESLVRPYASAAGVHVLQL